MNPPIIFPLCSRDLTHHQWFKRTARQEHFLKIYICKYSTEWASGCIWCKWSSPAPRWFTFQSDRTRNWAKFKRKLISNPVVQETLMSISNGWSSLDSFRLLLASSYLFKLHLGAWNFQESYTTKSLLCFLRLPSPNFITQF